MLILILIAYETIKLKTIQQHCQHIKSDPIIKNKHIYRSFEDEQNNPIPIQNLFNKMFAEPSPWMMSRGIGLTDKHVIYPNGRIKNTDLKNQKLNFDFRPKKN